MKKKDKKASPEQFMTWVEKKKNEELPKNLGCASQDTAKTITPKQLMEWVKTNEHRTWSLRKGWGTGGTHEVKYLRFHLDTRDMKIYRIDVDGLGMEEAADFREEFDGNLLELLEYKLKIYRERGMEPKEDFPKAWNMESK